MSYWVYVHTCPNGKKYVGCTKQTLSARWHKGNGYRGQFFFRAIIKYGWDNIVHEVFEVESEEEMYTLEAELIKTYHSNDPKYGYNCTEGGEGFGVHKATPSSWKKGHETWNKGKSNPHSEEWRKKVSEKNRGRINKGPKSEEHRKHLSESHKNKPHPQPKYKYLLPDGQVKMLMPSHAKRFYINKGITIIKID